MGRNERKRRPKCGCGRELRSHDEQEIGLCYRCQKDFYEDPAHRGDDDENDVEEDDFTSDMEMR